jgi:hypothetical protein
VRARRVRQLPPMRDGLTIHISRRAIIIFVAVVAILFVLVLTLTMFGHSSGSTGTGSIVP